jgi:hypothetical protein
MRGRGRGRGRGPGGPPHPGHPRGGPPRAFHPGPPPPALIFGQPPRPRRGPLRGFLLHQPQGERHPIFPVGFIRLHHHVFRRYQVPLPPDVVVGERVAVLIDGLLLEIDVTEYASEVVVAVPYSAVPIGTSAETPETRIEGIGTVVRSCSDKVDNASATDNAFTLSDPPSSSSISICSTCTFENPRGQALCLMCETPLLSPQIGLPIAEKVDTVFGHSI